MIVFNRYINWICFITLIFSSCNNEKEINKDISIKFYPVFTQEEIFKNLLECDSVTNLNIRTLPIDTNSMSYHYKEINRSFYYDAKVYPILHKFIFYFDDSVRTPYISRDIYIGNVLRSDTNKIRNYLQNKICEDIFKEKPYLKWYNVNRDTTLSELFLLKSNKEIFAITLSDIIEIQALISHSLLQQLNALLGKNDDQKEYDISFILSDAKIKELSSLNYNYQSPFLAEIIFYNRTYINQISLKEVIEKGKIVLKPKQKRIIGQSIINNKDVEFLSEWYPEKFKVIKEFN